MKKLFLKELRIYNKSYQKSFYWTFICSIIIFIFCFTLSFFIGDFFIEQTEALAESIANDIAEMSGKKINELSNLQTFSLIFWNNTKLCAITILLGIIPLYRLPSFFTLLQFIMIGVVFGGLSAMGHNVVNAFFFSFLPHAIIELIALIYSASIGNSINQNILTKIFLRKKKDSEPIGNLIKQAFRSYIYVVIPLLIIAAFIEVFITAKLSEVFL